MLQSSNSLIADRTHAHTGRFAQLAWSATAVFGFALLTALAASYVRVPVPGTPVPMTAQTLVVLLAGFLLGPGRGALSQGVYILLGLIGLPVFAAAPITIGYIVGFILAAEVVARLHRRLGASTLAVLATATAGTAVILLCGATWLAFTGGGVQAALLLGVLPFLPGAAIKIAICVGIIRVFNLRSSRPSVAAIRNMANLDSVSQDDH